MNNDEAKVAVREFADEIERVLAQPISRPVNSGELADKYLLCRSMNKHPNIAFNVELELACMTSIAKTAIEMVNRLEGSVAQRDIALMSMRNGSG